MQPEEATYNEEEETILYQTNTHVKSFAINDEQERPCSSLIITSKCVKLGDLPPIPFDKISLHAINRTESDASAENTTTSPQSYLYCHLTGFVKLAAHTMADSDDDYDDFEELRVMFHSDHELQQVFEAMSKGAGLVPYVDEMNDGDGADSGDDEWIYNEDEVRKNTHLHERDEEGDTDDNNNNNNCATKKQRQI